MNVNKTQNTAEQKVGVDTTPFLLGKIQYGKLKTIHVPLIREEIQYRTNTIPDEKSGIRALTSILQANEKEATGEDLKCS